MTEATHTMTVKIGTTTFFVGIGFNDKAKENLEDRILRMARNDVRSPNFANPPLFEKAS